MGPNKVALAFILTLIVGHVLGCSECETGSDCADGQSCFDGFCESVWSGLDDLNDSNFSPDTGGPENVDTGPCIADCTSRECGDDGCGGDCGSCDDEAPFCVQHLCEITTTVWVSLPAGTFTMGSNSETAAVNEQPEHEVTVGEFELSEGEVTVNDYGVCLTAGACSLPGGSSTEGICHWDVEGYDEYPINCVDWDQAGDYCAWLGGRLPSEAEWEYAAKSGGMDYKYPWGNSAITCDHAVADTLGGVDCGAVAASPICSKPLGNTEQGLCDMVGNVREWTLDNYHENYTGAPDDGSPWTDGSNVDRVTRGSGYGNSSMFLTTTRRLRVSESDSRSDVGFRCAR